MRDGESSGNFEGEYSPEMIECLRKEYNSLYLQLTHIYNKVHKIYIDNYDCSTMEDTSRLSRIDKLLEEYSRKDRRAMGGGELEFSISEFQWGLDNLYRIGMSYGVEMS